MKLLHGRNLSLALGGRRILEAVDIHVEAGEMLGLIGPNGAGKSSLLKLIAGLQNADSGSLYLGSTAYTEMSPAARSRHIAWLSQQAEVHWPLSVETLIELGRAPHLAPWERPSETDRKIIERIIEQTDLRSLRQRPFNTLSGGEQARVLLARALATQPRILLADEPVAALDLAHQLVVMSLLSGYCRAGNGVIVVLHDLSLASHFCDRLLLLQQGKLLAAGAPDAVLSLENISTAYRISPRKAFTGDPFSLPWQRLEEDPGGAQPPN
jgi:iron complex transport system ATP-binding protein